MKPIERDDKCGVLRRRGNGNGGWVMEQCNVDRAIRRKWLLDPGVRMNRR
jgi:hypothetical protein